MKAIKSKFPTQFGWELKTAVTNEGTLKKSTFGSSKDVNSRV